MKIIPGKYIKETSRYVSMCFFCMIRCCWHVVARYTCAASWSRVTQLFHTWFSMILTPNPIVTPARVVLSVMLHLLETQQFDNWGGSCSPSSWCCCSVGRKGGCTNKGYKTMFLLVECPDQELLQHLINGYQCSSWWSVLTRNCYSILPGQAEPREPGQCWPSPQSRRLRGGSSGISG